MSQGGDFLKDISNLLRDTESLLMDFDMQAPPQVVNLDDEDEDSVVVVASTEDEPSPAVPSNRRQPRTAGGIRRRAGASAAATNRRNQLMMSIVDLCSPIMGPPSSSTSALPTGRRRARGTNRRGGRRGARARNSSSESEIDLDNSIVELDDSGPSTAFEAIATPSSSSSAAALNDTSDGSGPHCPICLCQWTSPVSTLCGHIFCKNCIAQWIKVTKSCPVCKAGAAKLKTHPIFIS